MKSTFTSDTVDCYYHGQLCRLALRKTETFKQDFISAYNRNPDLLLTLQDIQDGEFVWSGGMLAPAVFMPESTKTNVLANTKIGDGTSPKEFLQYHQEMIDFIQRASLTEVQKLVQSLSDNSNSVSKRTLVTAYIAYAARLKRMGKGVEELKKIKGADANLLKTAREIVWPSANTETFMIWQKLAAVGIAMPMQLSWGNELSILGQGLELSITVDMAEVAALASVSAEIALPMGAVAASLFFIYEAISANHVGNYMQSMRVSQREERLITNLLQEMSAQSAEAWNVAIPQAVPMPNSDITLLQKAVRMDNVVIDAKTLTRIAEKVKKHETCRAIHQGAVPNLGDLSNFPESHTTYSDPFTRKHLNLFHGELRREGICGFQNVKYDAEPGMWGDCLTKTLNFIPVASLKNNPKFTDEVNMLERAMRYQTLGFKRLIYTNLPKMQQPKWTVVDEIPLVFSNGNQIREIFGQLPSGFLNAKSGSAIYGKPEYPQLGVGWFRRGEHEFKSITKNIPEPLAKHFFPEKPNGTDYKAAKVIRHVHYEELQKTDDGEYFICSHSLYYPAEFWNPYPKTGY